LAYDLFPLTGQVVKPVAIIFIYWRRIMIITNVVTTPAGWIISGCYSNGFYFVEVVVESKNLFEAILECRSRILG